MCVSTTNIRRNCAPVVGGISSTMYIVLKDDVLTFPAVNVTTGVVDTAFTLKAGKAWAVWQTERNELSYTIKSGGEGTPGGFEAMIEGFFKGRSKAMEKTLQDNLAAEFVVILTDKDGTELLFGDVNEGVFFKGDGIEYQSGKKFSDKKGITIKMSWDTIRAPYEYTPAITPLVA